jgi:hypothetical protein
MPELSDVVGYIAPVVVEVNLMVAPLTAAPEGSKTTPVTLAPVCCPNSCSGTKARSKRIGAILFITVILLNKNSW